MTINFYILIIAWFSLNYLQSYKAFIKVSVQLSKEIFYQLAISLINYICIHDRNYLFFSIKVSILQTGLCFFTVNSILWVHSFTILSFIFHEYLEELIWSIHTTNPLQAPYLNLFDPVPIWQPYQVCLFWLF
jgi:hypothetical protein